MVGMMLLMGMKLNYYSHSAPPMITNILAISTSEIISIASGAECRGLVSEIGGNRYIGISYPQISLETKK